MKFIKYSITACLLVMLCSASNNAEAQATDRWKEAIEDGYTYRYVTGDPMHARFYKLKNGLTVILSVNKKDPRIQTLIGVRAGSNNDPDDHTGLAHYLEHLLFKGTDKYGSLDWAKEKPYLDQIEQLYDTYNHTTDAVARKAIYHQIDSVSGLAAHFAIANEYQKALTEMGAQGTNAHTSVEETVFQEDIPSSSLDKYLAVQAERYRYPVFRLFHTELEAVYEEKNRGLDNDNQKIFAALLNGLFPTTNYGQHTTIGTIEDLKNPSLTAIRNFYNTYYVPNNMSIVLAGDFDPTMVIKKIDHDFSYMQPKQVKEYDPAPEKPITSPIVRDVFGPDAESVYIGYRMPGGTDVETQVLLNVLSDLLSNGTAGLLDLNLNKQQKVLSSGAFVQEFKYYSALVVSGRPKKGQSLAELQGLLQDQIEKIKKGDFDGSLVKAIINNEKLNQMRSLDNNGFRANNLMDSFIHDSGNGWDGEVAVLDRMSKVTKEQVVNFANKYLGNNYVLVNKRIGEDKSIVKVDKPAITPVYINKKDESPFLKQIAQMPATVVNPVWVDYDHDILKGKIGPAQLLYVKNKENGLFTLSYRFDMGSYNNKLLPFAAKYIQYLGTDRYSAEELTKAFYNIACSYSINVTGDVTVVSITGLQDNFDKASMLFESLFAGCKPDQQALADLKQSILKSRENNKLNKTNIARGLIQYAMYGPVNPFNNQLSNEAINTMAADTLVNILHTLFSNQHKIVYYGPLTMAEASARISKLHKLPLHFIATTQPVKFTKTDEISNQVLFADYNQVQAEVYWIRNTVPYSASNITDLAIYNKYYGDGMGSVVFQTIRESKALAYSTYAQYASPIKEGERYSEVGYVGTQADKMSDAVKAMSELYNDMPENDQLFQNSKTSIKQDLSTQRIVNEDIINNYFVNQRLGIKDDYRKQEFEQLDKVNFSDIQKIHNDNLKNKPFTYCILGSKDKIAAADLVKFGNVKVLTLEEIFGY